MSRMDQAHAKLRVPNQVVRGGNPPNQQRSRVAPQPKTGGYWWSGRLYATLLTNVSASTYCVASLPESCRIAALPVRYTVHGTRVSHWNQHSIHSVASVPCPCCLTPAFNGHFNMCCLPSTAAVAKGVLLRPSSPFRPCSEE